MALQVWLPLNGTLENKGLSDINITVTGTTSYTTGKIGNGLNCNGSSYWIIKPVILTNNCSFCFWSKTSDADAMFFVVNSVTYVFLNFWLYYGKYYLNVGDSLKNPFQNDGTDVTAHSDNIWHHYTITFDGTQCLLYIDGNYYGKAKTYRNPTTTSANEIKIAGGFSNGHSHDLVGILNDFRIYDHCLSPKEVHDLALGLVLHYKLDDMFSESTTNLITTSDCLSSTCYNNATNKYGYGANTDIYKTTGIFEGKFCTKVYMGTSGLDAYPYTYVNNLYVSNGTNSPLYKTLSFDYFGTIGTVLIPYKLGSGNGICKWTNNLTGSGQSTSTANISVIPGKWNHITMTLSGTTDADAKWGYIRLGSTSHTSDTSNYWLFANMQLETKDHETGYAGVGGTRTSSLIYDTSGYQNNGSIIGNLTILSDSARYANSTSFDGNTSGILIQNFNLSNIINTALTYSFWIKPNSENGARSVYFGSYSNTSFSIEKTTTNKLRLWWNGSPDLTSTLTIVDDQWQHIAITKSGNTEIKAYLNGTLILTFTKTFNNITFPTTYRIGRDSRDGATSYNGLMSDFRIYTTVLSDDDILDLYKVGASVDNKLNFYAYEILENGSLQILPKTNISLTGYTSYYSPYLSISPGVYDYDITYEATGSDNWNLIGFERWDENKTSTSNSGCVYVHSKTGASSKTRIFGTVNLTTDLNSNPVAFTRLRVLNDWNNKNASNSLTIYSISLMKSGTYKPLLILHTGEAICNEFQELDNTSIRSNGITETNNIYEI